MSEEATTPKPTKNFTIAYTRRFVTTLAATSQWEIKRMFDNWRKTNKDATLLYVIQEGTDPPRPRMPLAKVGQFT